MDASAQLMLDEINSESLLQLLTSVQYETSPPGSTQIPALDSHFFSAVQHHPSPLSSLNRGDVLEIQGPPSSGKTHLLYFLLATCILPHSSASTLIGGWEKAAFVFDTDGSFNMSRFKKILLGRLKRLLPSHAPSLQDIALSCLHRLHVFRPNSSVQLAVTIMHLPNHLATRFPDAEMGLVAIDSISAFYWQDRFTVEQLQYAPTYRTQRVASPLQNVLFALQSLRISHGPVIAITNWGLIPANDPNSIPTSTVFYKQHLDLFPSILTIPRPDSLSSISPHADSSHSLPLTHHITLCTVSNGLPKDKKPEISDPSNHLDARKLSEEAAFRGTVRTSGRSRISDFIFHISADDMIVT